MDDEHDFVERLNLEIWEMGRTAFWCVTIQDVEQRRGVEETLKSTIEKTRIPEIV